MELGEYGRYLVNVWSYAGSNTLRRGREEDLADHGHVLGTELAA